MNVSRKILGLVAGTCATAAIGVAVAQGVQPDPDVSNPALGAGQQSVHQTPMGETGVLAWEEQMQPMASSAQVAPEPVAQAPEPAPPEPVAQAPEPAAPEPVAQAPAPEPAPAPVAQAPEPAAPEPVQMAQAPAPRADRN